MAQVFSGILPRTRVFKNSQANSFVDGALNNLVTASVDVVFNDKPTSSILGSVFTPGLVDTGVQVLNQTLVNAISNSKALGPFGPLAGSLASAGVNILRDTISNSLFGGAGAETANATKGAGTQYFPGAGRNGETAADYRAGGRSSAYTLGNGGADVVFTISPALTPAASEASATSSGAPGTPVGTAPAASPTTGSAAAPAPAPAATPSPGATPPAKEQPGAVKPTSEAKKPTPEDTAWTFICAPEDISWETTAQAERVPIFGANQVPVIGGLKGMRDLTLNGAIVEGFSRGRSVEDKIIALEKLMRMSMSADKRYVRVPVYKVTANSKVYGNGTNEKGYFIIKNVKVQEKIRDLSGRTTRAIVDISFVQVPSYQVDDGRDIAYSAIAGAQGPFVPIATAVTTPARTAYEAIQRTATAAAPAPAAAATPPAAAASPAPPATASAAATTGTGLSPSGSPTATTQAAAPAPPIAGGVPAVGGQADQFGGNTTTLSPEALEAARLRPLPTPEQIARESQEEFRQSQEFGQWWRSASCDPGFDRRGDGLERGFYCFNPLTKEQRPVNRPPRPGGTDLSTPSTGSLW